jgi:formate/nitrite transporter FocA (FNT family)
MSGAASVSQYFLVFLVPTLIGNILGGVSLVAIVNHAAIAPEINGTPQNAD